MKIGLLRLKQWFRYIPTSLTLGNSLCGFGAILHTLTAYRPSPNEEVPQLLAFSAWLIVGAMLFDMLDGWSARMLHAHSPHGVQMDSLADMVTFGVAPAVIVAVMAHTNAPMWLPYRWVWAMSAIYLGCTALRLALYNVKAAQGDCDDGFHGLPSPGGAAAVASLVILYANPINDFDYMVLAQVLPFYAALIGFLMVSNVPYMHLGHWLGSRRKNKLKVLCLIIFCAFFAWNRRLVAAIAANAYVLSGPVTVLARWIVRRRLHTEASTAEVAP